MIQNSVKPVCLVIANQNLFREIVSLIRSHYSVIFGSTNSISPDTIRIKSVTCIILTINSKESIPSESVTAIKYQYPLVPFISIMSDYSMETVRYCGEIGINRVINQNQISLLAEIIQDVTKKSSARVSLKDFGIDIYQISGILKEILMLIEENYVSITNVQQIASHIHVSESVISRELSKANLINPKRLLLYFKVRHALNLMYNRGFRLNEISELTGFTNERRFNECFHRVFGKSPSACRQMILQLKKKENFVRNWDSLVRIYKQHDSSEGQEPDFRQG
jgi:AraC-like DNA-binding protein